MFISGFPPLLHNKGVVITLFGIDSNCPIDAIKHKRLSTVNSKDLCRIFVTANGAPVNALGPAPRNQIPIASDPRSSGSCPQIPRRWGPSIPGCQKSAWLAWLEVSNYSKTRHLGWIFPPAPNTNTLGFFNVIVWLDMLSDIAVTNGSWRKRSQTNWTRRFFKRWSRCLFCCCAGRLRCGWISSPYRSAARQ